MATLKHDGKLDDITPGSGNHVECRLASPGVIVEAEDIVGRTIVHTYLSPKQALSLLAWLQQEREKLEQSVMNETQTWSR